MSDPIHTAVFHSGALGDSVILWPLLRAWAADGSVAFIAPTSHARLAAAHLAGVTGYDGDAPDGSRLFTAGAADAISGPMQAVLNLAHRVISTLSDGYDTWAGNVRALAPNAALAFVKPNPPTDSSVHALDHQRTQLTEQGVAAEPIQPAARATADGPIVIHPGSGGRDKCWPADRYEQLIGQLRAAGRRLIVILGPVEREWWPDQQVCHWCDRYEVAEPSDALALAQTIGEASLYIGNDSGPTHLAAQLGVKSVALFGPTDPRVWAPTGPAVTIVAPPSPGSIEAVSVQQVIAAAQGE